MKSNRIQAIYVSLNLVDPASFKSEVIGYGISVAMMLFVFLSNVS